jgi:RimJ/RimL family protein N-acetyltransferase
MSESIRTARLVLRRPTMSDAEAIFAGYATDEDVTRYLGWRRHRTVDDTRAFLSYSEQHWTTHGTGPFLAFEGECLVGSTGLQIEAEHHASTGYLLVKEAWGKGYATEMARAMAILAFTFSKIQRLSATTHADHAVSGRVLEKAGFTREGRLGRYLVFPNLGPDPCDVQLYARVR